MLIKLPANSPYYLENREQLAKAWGKDSRLYSDIRSLKRQTILACVLNVAAIAGLIISWFICDFGHTKIIDFLNGQSNFFVAFCVVSATILGLAITNFRKYYYDNQQLTLKQIAHLRSYEKNPEELKIKEKQAIEKIDSEINQWCKNLITRINQQPLPSEKEIFNTFIDLQTITGCKPKHPCHRELLTNIMMIMSFIVWLLGCALLFENHLLFLGFISCISGGMWTMCFSFGAAFRAYCPLLGQEVIANNSSSSKWWIEHINKNEFYPILHFMLQRGVLDPSLSQYYHNLN